MRIGCGLQDQAWLFSDDCASRECGRYSGGRQQGRITVKRASRWGSLGERVAKLKDGESIVLECEGELTEEARKIRSGLNSIAA
jgi:hypothetical protein